MRWVNLFILTLLAIGHAELVVTLLNRVHGFRVRCKTLSRLRYLHDLLLPGVALTMVLFVGLAGPRLLAGGSWSDVPPGWLAWFALCALGLVGLVASSVRWLLRKPPACQTANHSTVIDIAGRLGDRPVDRGPLRVLTHVPGNEIFQLEVAEKTFVLPRLPAEWDGLSILQLSDLHFIGTLRREFFERVIELAAGLEADLAVFTGDLVDRQDLTSWLPETLARLDAPLGRYFILGNHDWFLDPEATRREMTAVGWQSVAGRTITIEHRGRCLVLGGTELPWMGGFPTFESQPARSAASLRGGREGAAARMEDGSSVVRRPWSVVQSGHPAAPGAQRLTLNRQPATTTHHSALTTHAFRILLSHTPDHIGWARRHGVDLMLAGHNHGGQVVLPVLGPVYSPSRHGVRYAGGAYWAEPTLLYVSRGISGRHPLRWNCRPEITKLVLRVG